MHKVQADLNLVWLSKGDRIRGMALDIALSNRAADSNLRYVLLVIAESSPDDTKRSQNQNNDGPV